MLEWLKRHAWKACIRQNRISGSNPDLSARYFTFLLKACSHCAIAPESKITFKQDTMCKTTKHFSKGVFCNKFRFSKSVLLSHRKSRNLTMSSAEEATEYLFSSTIYPVILGMCSHKSDEDISHPELYHNDQPVLIPFYVNM